MTDQQVVLHQAEVDLILGALEEARRAALVQADAVKTFQSGFDKAREPAAALALFDRSKGKKERRELYAALAASRYSTLELALHSSIMSAAAFYNVINGLGQAFGAPPMPPPLVWAEGGAAPAADESEGPSPT